MAELTYNNFWRKGAMHCDNATAFGTLLLAGPIPGTDPPLNEQVKIFAFFALQSGMAGFLVGYLFQQHYRRSRSVPGAVVGDIRLQARPV
jgi:hypothetical protein